jgi:hypothetical protein
LNLSRGGDDLTSIEYKFNISRVYSNLLKASRNDTNDLFIFFVIFIMIMQCEENKSRIAKLYELNTHLNNPAGDLTLKCNSLPH